MNFEEIFEETFLSIWKVTFNSSFNSNLKFFCFKSKVASPLFEINNEAQGDVDESSFSFCKICELT